jgi:hypothetical protein
MKEVDSRMTSHSSTSRYSGLPLLIMLVRLALYTALLLLTFSILISYTGIHALHGGSAPLSRALWSLFLLAAIALLGLEFLGKGTKRVLLRALFSLPFILFLAALRVDAPRPNGLYSEEDLIIVSADTDAAHELFLTLKKKGRWEERHSHDSSHLRLSRVNSTNIAEHAEEIETAWAQVVELHELVTQLSELEVVTDRANDSLLTVEGPGVNRCNVRHLGHLYRAKTLLMASQGDYAGATRNLATFHIFTRKALESSTLLISRMLWVALAEMNIETARTIARAGECPTTQLRHLADAFAPLSTSEVSLRRSIIAEHICFVNLIAALRDRGARGLVTTSVDTLFDSEDDPAFIKWVLAYTFLPNRTIRARNDQTDQLLQCLALSDLEQFDDYLDKEMTNPPLLNFGGWFVNWLSQMSPQRSYKRTIEVQAQSQALADDLTGRLPSPSK